MKKFAIMFLLALVAATFATTTTTPSLSISVINISETVRPGSSFTMHVQVLNNGVGTATNVTVSPVIAVPFKVKTGTSEVVPLGNIGLGQAGTAKLHLMALPDTPADVYDLEFTTTYQSGTKQFSITKTISISVEASPTLEITEAEYGIIYPGDFAELSLTIQNIGNGEARNIRAVYSNASGAILPAGSAVAYISSMAPGKSKTVGIPISIAGAAEAGAYSIAITVSYEDQDGTPQTTLSRTIGLRIESDIELKAFLDSGGVVQGVPSEVVFSIANTGPNTAQFLEIMPVQTPGTKLTPNSIYIGNLESDDFDTAEFEVTTSVAGEQDIQLKLVYKDHFNQKKEVTRTLGINVLTPTEAAALQERSMVPMYGLALLILVAIGWYWRRRKKKHARAA